MHAGGGHERSAGAESTVKTITYEAALLGPQEGDHLLGCRHLHLGRPSDHLGLDGRQPPCVRVHVVGADVCLELPRAGPGLLVVVEAVPLDQVLEVGAEQAMLYEALDRPLPVDLPPQPAAREEMDVQLRAIGKVGSE